MNIRNRPRPELDPCDPRQYIDPMLKKFAPTYFDTTEWSKFKEKPLNSKILKGVRYIFAVESHTPSFAIVPTLNLHNNRSPGRSALRAVWELDEYFHGLAAWGVLKAHDDAFPEFEKLRAQDAKKNERFGHIIRPLKSMIFNGFYPQAASGGTNLIAVLNEKVTGTLGYKIIGELSENDQYRHLTDGTARDEARHARIFMNGAHQDLDENPRAQKVARKIVDRWGGMPGYQVMPTKDTNDMINLMATHEDFMPNVEKIDRFMQNLPGMVGATTLQNFIEPRLACRLS